jgi:hypothetical protein
MGAMRSAQARPRVTEEELLARGSITPDDVLGLQKACKSTSTRSHSFDVS